MPEDTALSSIRSGGIVAIMRAKSSDQLLAAADAILAGGVNAIEVTMTTPGALRVVEQATARYGSEVIFGAGTVLDAETARAAILSGAQFIVSPTLDLDTIRLCKRYRVPVFPGAFTPTEILTAWQAGADIVKVFPAEFGGPGYIKAVRAPLPQVRLMPVGGVDITTAADFIRAGSEALGVGSALINQKLLDDQDYAELTNRAERLRRAVDEARSGKAGTS